MIRFFLIKLFNNILGNDEEPRYMAVNSYDNGILIISKLV